MKTRDILYIAGLLLGQSVFAQTLENDSLAMKFGNAVSGDVLNQSVRTNVANTLFGRLKGLYTMQGSSETNVLDDQASFNIRGISTFGNAKPLIIVDGVQRDLENLSLIEIEKVEVLKDAVASAMYGVQGANGAILITTKRGKSGFHASANYSMSFDTPFRLPEFADAATYASAMNEALTLDGLSPRYSVEEIEYFKNGAYREIYPDVDWQDVAYRNYGVTHRANVEFEGGTNRFKFYTALDYSNQTGILDHTDMFSQYRSQLNKVNLNLRANIDVTLTDKTFLKLNLLGRLKEQNRPGTGMSDIITRLYTIPAAAFPVKTGTGHWGGNNIYSYNPIADIADRGTVKVIRRSLLADMTLHQKLDFITEGLYAEAMVAYDNMANFNDSRTRTYEYEMVVPVVDNNNVITGVDRIMLGTKGELGWSSELNGQDMFSMLQAKVGYDRNFGMHKVKGEVVYQQLASVPNGRNATRKNQSIMGIVNYQYSDRYSIDGVLNYSGSAVLTEGRQFNVYPAIGLGWTASNEDFLKNHAVISYLKVNASLGLSGSDLFGHDLDKQSFGLNGANYWFGSGNTQSTGLKEGNLPVTHLLAEKSRKFDVGFDIALWKKLYVSATYFNERRSNILVEGSPVVSSVIGIGVPQLCEGIVNNQGVELSFDLSDKIGRFGYSLSGNFTYAKNKIINNNEGFKTEDYLYKKGQSLNQYYGLQSDGFFNTVEEINNSEVYQSFGELKPGDVRYVDQNDDKIINEDDVVRLGYSTLPEIYYGFNVGLSYGGFGVMANFQGVANRSLYLNTANVYAPLKNNTNISTWYLEENTRWTPGTMETANLPRLTSEDNPNNFQKSDIWMANGNYLKLRDLEVSYTINRNTLRKCDLKIFVRGTNLFSIDKLGYSDPENYGVAYPTMRSYTAGFNLIF